MATKSKKIKKGPYRKVTKVEILEPTKARKKGEVVEMHPVLADMLIEAKKAKVSTKELTNKIHIGGGTSKVNTEKS